MSLTVQLAKDAKTYYERVGTRYLIPYGHAYTVDVLFHGDFANDDERYRIKLKIDGKSVGVAYTVKKEMETVDGARRVTFDGFNLNSAGTERAAFVVVDPEDAEDDETEDNCGIVCAYAERGRWVECEVDDGKVHAHSTKKARIASKTAVARTGTDSSSSQWGAPAATSKGEVFAANGFELGKRKFKVDKSVPVIRKQVAYSGI